VGKWTRNILIELATIATGLILGAVFIKLMFVVGFWVCQKP